MQTHVAADKVLHLLTDGMPSVNAAVRKATEADAQRPPQQDSASGAHAVAPAEAADATSQPLLTASASVSLCIMQNNIVQYCRLIYGEPAALSYLFGRDFLIQSHAVP